MPGKSECPHAQITVNATALKFDKNHAYIHVYPPAAFAIHKSDDCVIVLTGLLPAVCLC